MRKAPTIKIWTCTTLDTTLKEIKKLAQGAFYLKLVLAEGLTTRPPAQNPKKKGMLGMKTLRSFNVNDKSFMLFTSNYIHIIVVTA